MLSQPTISAHVSALEEELATQLFDRLGRSVLPTQAGDVLFRYAQTIFRQLDLARCDILALSQRVAGELAIGGSTIPAHYIIPRLVTRYLAAYPEVRLDFTVGDSRDITDRVVDGALHVGLVGAACRNPDLVCRPFLDDALVLVAPASMAAPQLHGDGWKDRLVALPWVMREPGSGTREALRQALEAVGVDTRVIQPVLSVHSSLAVLECVEAGLGVSVVSHLAAKPYLDRGAVRSLEAPQLSMRRQFFTVHHARRYQFPALAAFLEFCHGA